MDAADSSPRSFAASYDRLTLIVTGIVILITVAMGFLLRIPVAAALLAIVVIVTYAFSPRSYTLDGRLLRVQRLVGDFIIPLDGLRLARRVSNEELRGSVRLWASGGLFGYFGVFRTPAFGSTRWYVTNLANRIILVIPSRTVLVSPDDVDGFLALLDVHPSEAPLPFPPSTTRWPRLLMIIPAALGILAVVFSTYMMSYSPGPVRTTLTRDVLEIHDRFYPVTIDAHSVPPDQVRIVDLDGEPQWQPVRRTNGFANSHYSSGWFELAGGRKVRLYRAGGKQLVLIPAREATILLEAPDPQAFVDVLQREWGQRK